MNNLYVKIFLAILLVVILMTQGFWMFNDARKRGDKRYWLWGIFGLLNFPTNLIVYLIITRVIIDRNRKNNI